MKFSDYEYKRPSIDEVKKEMGQLIVNFKAAMNAEEQVELIKKINKVRMEFESALMLAHIRHTLDTTDPFYEEEFNYLNQINPEYELIDSEFYRALLDSPYQSELKKTLGEQLFNVAESKVKIISPEVMELLTEENRLTNNYQKLISTASISFNHEEHTLAKIEKYLSDPDRETRKRAAQAKYEFFYMNRGTLDDLFDKLVHSRDTIAKKLGFKSFTELAYLRWNRNGWDKESAKAFRDNVLKYILPLSLNLVESQKSQLGVESVKIYDEKVQFKSGNPLPKGDANWIVKQGEKLYSDLSVETKNFYKEMTDKNLFDLINKNGKANVGYCTYLWKQRVPFIFANFNGTSNDIRILIHEVGHAFQAYLALDSQELPEYFFPTMEASEIFSMSMELFVFPMSELFFKEDADKHNFSHLSESLVKLLRLCAGDEFQEEVYENPDLSPQERRMLWSKIEKKYMPYRDNDHIPFLEEGGIWQEITHFYEVPFYFIDYALAQICALQFWRMANEDWNHAWKVYMHLCKLGGSKSFLELLNEGNLQSPFKEQTFIELESFIKEELVRLELHI